MRRDNAAYIWDIVTHARELRGHVAGVSRERYLGSLGLQRTVERVVEIIGEAARHVSPAFRAQHPDVSWQAITAQRHVLAHDYGRIDQELLWNVATLRVPELLARIEGLLPADPPADAVRDEP